MYAAAWTNVRVYSPDCMSSQPASQRPATRRQVEVQTSCHRENHPDHQRMVQLGENAYSREGGEGGSGCPEEAFDFSHVKYVSIDGLGSTCISVPPSPCKIGESTQLGLTLPSKDARDCIEHVQMQLVQQTQICKSSRSSIYTQTIPTLALKLHTQPSPGPVDFASQKGYSAEDSVLEAHFSIPTDVQPSTLAGSTAVINVSHRMQMTINFKHTPQLRMLLARHPRPSTCSTQLRNRPPPTLLQTHPSCTPPPSLIANPVISLFPPLHAHHR